MRRKRKILVSNQSYGLSRLKGETRLHVSIAAYLRSKDKLFHHSPNEGKRSHFQQWLIKKMGVSSGFPDFVIYEQGLRPTDYYIEVKYGSNKLTPNQLKWLKELTHKGKICFVVWSEYAARVAIAEMETHGLQGKWYMIDNACWVHEEDELPPAIKKKIKSQS